MNEKKSKTRIMILFFALLMILALAVAVIVTAKPADTELSASVLIPVSAQKQIAVLKSDSRWAGILTVSDHKGEGVLENGTRAVRGMIGRTGERTYFELFNREDPEGAEPILSLWVSLNGDSMVPIIGEDDAWYFDILLDARDVEAFTLRLSDGRLSQRYFYDSGMETCWIEFQIKPEKRA